jgi:acyl-CoA hydrolase
VTERVTTITRLVFPDQANHHGTLFGGEALGMLASCGSIAAHRRAKTEVVLASSGSVDFVAPIPLGSIVESRASVVRIGRTSLEVEATLEAEDLISGRKWRACAARFVLVAVDGEGIPTPVAPSTDVKSDRSQEETRSVERVLPGNANPNGVLLGGELMRFLDSIAFVAATRAARAPLVTAHAEKADFVGSAEVGELVLMGARVMKTGGRSLVVQVDALAENPTEGVTRPCTTARFVFVRPRVSSNPQLSRIRRTTWL